MNEPIRHPARHHVTSHPYWERLRWDDEHWYGHTLTDIAETVAVLVNHSRGHELPMISALTDLLDEDVYSNASHVAVSPSTTPGARAFAAEINEGRTCGDALRALLDAAGDIESMVTDLIEIALSHNGAWEAVVAGSGD